jgi:Na+-translocating ferredoxin:NAD+ oxidoreductase subunit C
MKLKTFQHGIHPGYYKELTSRKATEVMPVPAEIVVPLQQNIGAPCKPTVKPKDSVQIGQVIGDSDAFVSCPVHASVAGVVVKIEPRPHPIGSSVNAIVIAADSDVDQTLPARNASGDVTAFAVDEIRAAIKQAGLVGLGGAGFPTHIKLAPPKGKTIDTVIINAAECEPYLTSDHRMMLEQPDDVIYGTKLIMRAFNLQQGVIGIEANKPDAIDALKRAIKPGDGVEIVALEVKYPQGAEKMLIEAVTGRRVPPGGLPMDVHANVDNVSGAVAVARAVRDAAPVLERIVTVTGQGVREPKNVLVRVGTPIKDVIAFCGGLTPDARKVIIGGPMMGVAQATLDVPVVKTTGGILVLTDRETQALQPHACIRCGKCVRACPINLVPSKLGVLIERGMFEKTADYHVNDCMECGCCVYVCPAKRPMVQWIRLGKAALRARKR